MTLTDLIAPSHIILGLRAVDKAHALGEVAKRAGAQGPVAAPAILAALTAREALGSTGFGRGFALPHVRLEGLTAVSGLLVRLAKPIPFDAIDDKPVDILFVLLMPAVPDGTHVAALAAVSRTMRDDQVLRAIRRAGDPAALFTQLQAAAAPPA